jgi:hypothetical protein
MYLHGTETHYYAGKITENFQKGQEISKKNRTFAKKISAKR